MWGGRWRWRARTVGVEAVALWVMRLAAHGDNGAFEALTQ